MSKATIFKVFIAILVIIIAIQIHYHNLFADKLYEERIYQPVVLRGGGLSAFYDIPVNEIYMYAYHADTQTWELIPFQIDERVYAPDPMKMPDDTTYRHSYFLPDNGVLDADDEIAFMIGDLGDKAYSGNWIDNDESKSYERLELIIVDPNHNDERAFGYLYRSSTNTDQIPTPYEFSIDSAEQVISSKYYEVGLSWDNGLIEDVVIKPPFGNGVDIFDTQKFRLNGVFELGFPFPFNLGRNGVPSFNERDNIHLFKPVIKDSANFYFKYTKFPVVRLIREVRETLKFGDQTLDDIGFYVRTYFYPYSGTLSGGVSLDPDKLKEELGTTNDIYIELNLLRQSWDFNSAAEGMKFYNRYNQDIRIDGSPDAFNNKIDVPIAEWTLNTGDQGTMFTHVTFQDTSWQSIELYYYDNQQGGQGDDSDIPEGDTGDGVSYGDQGILFTNLSEDSVDLRLDFTAYFLDKNAEKSLGEQLAYWTDNPPNVYYQVNSFQASVDDQNPGKFNKQFKLFQNYPNPFNSSTKISFQLPYKTHVVLTIFDINGRIVKQLANQSLESGLHQVSWDGRDNKDQQVSSGLYLYELRSENFVLSNKLILLE